ncbi:DUF3237 domain-containing protein [[Mycobacterium] wendilense]|uniref:UPF0311 protein MU0050_001219 n=1 Tax=[Mycobacterium] wendilense TaxID=3064284 RepID=A0ABM9MB09_9MYCO|nr:DUF3237 domain-containing protein [Mycolicibacterium sp. MU0050]CAJ1580791.1 DUF3237 domain-containing protein [Mycolicibacterium sp. MU0050]
MNPEIDTTPTLEHLADIRLAISAVHAAPAPAGTRLTYVIGGGRCDGPALSGEFLAGGGDWVLVGTDGVSRLDVRATLRTDDGALVHVTNIGRVRMSPAAVDRFRTGELIRHDEMYGRSSPLFDSGDPRYQWLNGTYTLAVNEVSLTAVHYRVFAVG